MLKWRPYTDDELQIINTRATIRKANEVFDANPPGWWTRAVESARRAIAQGRIGVPNWTPDYGDQM